MTGEPRGGVDAHYQRLAARFDENWAHSAQFVAWMSGCIARRLELRPGQRVADIGCGTGLEREGLRWHVFCGQRRDHQVASFVQPDRAVSGGQYLLQFAERLTQLLLGRREGPRGVGGFADQAAELGGLVCNRSVNGVRAA